MIDDARGPQQPFWRLQNDKGAGRPPIWNVELPLGHDIGRDQPNSKQLIDAEAFGAFANWVTDLLTRTEDGALLLAREVVSHHFRLSAHFPQRRIEEICEAVRFPEAASHG